MARQTITITLYKSELIFDIENKTYLTGRSRDNGQNHEEVANMQANADEENRLQVMRSLGNAYSTLRTKLSEYLESSLTADTDTVMNDEGNIIITLKMPSNYNKATVETVTAALHQYIVNMAIADWFTITNKADAADYVAAAGANIEQVREAINKRVRPTRPQVATPVITLVQDAIIMTCATGGATIYYTSDGTTPTSSSTVFRSPITSAAAGTYKAIAMKEGLPNSEVATYVKS